MWASYVTYGKYAKSLISAFHAVFAVQTPSDAHEVFRLVEQGRSHVCWYGLLPVLRSGYLGSSWWQGSLLQDQSMQQRMQEKAQSRQRVFMQQIRTMPCRNTDNI